MNISFKNIPKFLYGGKGVSGVGNNGTWYNDVGQYIWDAIINKLQRAGEDNTYMYWLNGMLHAHDHLYDAHRDTINTPTFDVDTQAYLRAYKGEPNPKEFDNTYLSTKDLQKLGSDFLDNYNNYGIQKAFENNVFTFPKNPRSGDNPQRGFIADGYFSGITDYRRLLGRKGDYTDELLTALNKRLNAIGYNLIEYPEMYGDYYALVRLSNPVALTVTPPAQPVSPEKTPIEKQWEDDYRRRLEGSIGNGGTDVETGKMKEKFDWSKIRLGLQRALPDILEAGRLIGNYYNNERVYGELLKGIHPDLILSYQTHRLIVGDEATKLAYYRRAAQGETKAALPFTSDADRLMAYLFEAKRIGDELRALGDLADNLEIRRTSDESNQHQWANILRNTEVANANLKSINYADSLRHNLLALKHAANWTSFDNYLQGVGYKIKLRAAEEKNLQDLIFTLLELLDALNDPQFLNLVSNLEKVVKKHTDSSGVVDWKHPDITNALKDLQSYKIERTILSLKDKYKRNISIVKSGGKVTQKKKDDLLYKSTRDSVEHFRKMSKMSSDAQNRKRVKIEKLTPPPKTKKLLQGGVAPFTIYKPIVLGGETTRTTETSSGGSSKSSSKEKGTDILDLIKELFKNLGGLPSDSNGIYTSMLNLFKKLSVYGTEMSTEDLATMFLLQMLKVDAIKFNRSEFDKAKAIVDGKNANSEFAISPDGRVAVLNQNTGEVSLKKIEDIDSKVDNPLTNQNLLDLRAYNPNLAFNLEAIRVATYATTIDDITKFITDLLNNVKETENTIEGYTKKDSHLIKEGLQLLADAPEGVYKFAKTTKDNSVLINAALNYLLAVMPGNMKTLLALHTNGEPGKAVAYLASSRISNTNNLKFSAVTGQGAENAEKIKSNPIMQMILELGGTPRNYQLITRDSNILLSVDGTSYSQIPKITEDTSVANMLATSGFQVVTDSMYGITFGDLNISPEQLKDIMYPNEGAMVVTLPCKIVNGHKEVNLGVIDSYKEAVNEVESKGLSKNSQEYMLELGKALQEKGLTSLLTANGYPDKNKFSLFLVFSGYTTDKIKNLDTSSLFIEKVKNPDSALEDRMIKALSTDDKKTDYKLDIDYWLYGDDVYRGTVFIPLNNNLNAAINAYGSSVSVENARELENKKLNFDKASNMKPSNSDILYGTETE